MEVNPPFVTPFGTCSHQEGFPKKISGLHEITGRPDHTLRLLGMQPGPYGPTTISPQPSAQPVVSTGGFLPATTTSAATGPNPLAGLTNSTINPYAYDGVVKSVDYVVHGPNWGRPGAAPPAPAPVPAPIPAPEPDNVQYIIKYVDAAAPPAPAPAPAHEEHLRPWFGVLLKWLDDATNGGQDNVAVVHQVVPDSPAYRAGLEPEDQMEFWNGLKIDSEAIWKSLVSKIQIGDEIKLGIHRDHQDMETVVVITGTDRHKAGPFKVHSAGAADTDN